MNYPKIIKTVLVLRDLVLDTIAPPDPAIRRIELMKSWEFMMEALVPLGEKRSEGVLSFFPYRNKTVKLALIDIKSHGNKRLAFLMGTLLYEGIVREGHILGTLSEPLLLPIPITRKKLRERGWNQCNLIVDAFVDIQRQNLLHTTPGRCFIEVRKDILYKKRETADQVGRNRSERFENLVDSFAIKNSHLIKDRTVFIFDDIVTTGATLNEACRVIRNAGAKQVIPIALAH